MPVLSEIARLTRSTLVYINVLDHQTGSMITYPRWVYGTDVPPGRKAERVNAEDKMSVVSPPPAKPALPAPNPSSSDVQDLKAKLMDRTIEGQP